MSASEIQEYLVRLEKEVKDFKTELVRISWFLRGGVTLEQLLHVYSAEDRDAMYDVIKENVELTKASQMPLI